MRVIRLSSVALAAIFAVVAAPAIAPGENAGAGAATNGAPPAHLIWAERLVAEVSPDRNAYAWNPTYVVWDEDGNGPARNRSVCSSFVSHDLERAYGFGAAELRERFGTSNPQAKEYYAAVIAGRGFERIERLGDARPGDVVAIRYPAGSHPTGHVMILDGLPRARIASEPIVDGTTQYEAEVIDSSHSYHGSHDTRYHGKDASGGGVGRGPLRFYVDANGEVAGYTWSLRRISKYYPVSEDEVAIGRFETTYTGAAPPATAANGDDVDDPNT